MPNPVVLSSLVPLHLVENPGIERVLLLVDSVDPVESLFCSLYWFFWVLQVAINGFV